MKKHGSAQRSHNKPTTRPPADISETMKAFLAHFINANIGIIASLTEDQLKELEPFINKAGNDLADALEATTIKDEVIVATLFEFIGDNLLDIAAVLRNGKS